jgi:hypothetical protein
MRSRVLIPAAVTFVSACYIHTYVTPLNPEVRRPAHCAEAVTVYAATSEVTRKYIEIARIAIWHPPDMATTPEQELSVQRKKAAELGANGLILSHPPDRLQLREESSLAVFVPEDSVHILEVCVSPDHSK